MVTYEQSNFEEIATAIGVDVGQITRHETQFEEAALWYRLNKRRPARIAPSRMRGKLERVANSARRLLTTLGVEDPDKAADGLGDAELLHALVLSGEPNEDPVIEATRRVGRLMEIIDGVAAAAELGRRANQAANSPCGIYHRVFIRLARQHQCIKNFGVARTIGCLISLIDTQRLK